MPDAVHRRSGRWAAALARRGASWLPDTATSPARAAMCRWLAGTGQRAAALWLSQEQDAVLLSELGLHASAAERLRKITRPREAVAAVSSLAATGAHEQAFETAREALARWPAVHTTLLRPALGLRSELALLLVRNHPLYRAAVLHAAADPAAALDALEEGASTIPREAGTLLLRTSILRELGRHAEAQHCQDAACDVQSLRRVQFKTDLTGIGALACESQPTADGPLVSVVMPVHNVAAYLHVALASVLRQDHRALEVLVIDDASTDGSADIAESAARHDPRVQVLRLPRQRGAYGARNHGLSVARGEFVTFHDGDDWSHPQKIALQLEALQRDRHAIASLSDWARMKDDGRFTARQTFPLLRMNMSSLMLRRRPALARAGLFDAVLAGADSEYPARLELLFGSGSVLRVRRLLSFSTCRSDSLMHAAATGYSSPEGARQRLDYWEAWNRWHAGVYGRHDHARLRLDGTQRPFPVPASLVPGGARPGPAA